MNSEQKKESIASEGINLVPSILQVKASEDCEKSVASDLSVENITNKSIAELLDEEKNEQEEDSEKNTQ